MSEVFYTSDIHVGHRMVARIRGFHSTDEFEEHRGEMVPKADVLSHDIQLAHNWDSVVGEKDTIFVLGDISINGSTYALDWFRERPGNKILVSGNHDPVHPGFFRNSYRKIAEWREVFMDIQPYYRLRLTGQNVLLSHLPYSGTGAEGRRDNGEEIEERGPQWRLPDLGLPLIHGHTHGPEVEHISDNGTPEFHVGVDAHELHPVPQSTVLNWLDSL